MTHVRFPRFLQLILLAGFCVARFSIPALADNVTFEWANVGNPGNAADANGYGSVDYNYRISKHEVTNGQYTTFLNSVDPTGGNSLALYNDSMGFNANGGINFNVAAAIGSKYGVKSGRNNNPVIFVSHFDAMRFTNWLHNGQGTGSTEFGVYNIDTGLNETRAAGARFFIPREDEWYKSAYSVPNTAIYFDYPTSNNMIPTSEAPAGGANSANYRDSITGWAVTGSNTFDSAQNYLTDVGAYSNSLSPYGTLDQGGNVWERIEGTFSSFPALRGGSFHTAADALAATGRISGSSPELEFDNVGFRVAGIPEPSSLVLAALGTIGLLLRRRR